MVFPFLLSFNSPFIFLINVSMERYQSEHNCKWLLQQNGNSPIEMVQGAKCISDFSENDDTFWTYRPQQP